MHLGDGDDIFVFDKDLSGSNTILDFEPGSDTLVLMGVGPPPMGNDIVSVTADGDNTIVAVDDLSITLIGVQPEDIDTPGI